jgi:hypothetical protein
MATKEKFMFKAGDYVEWVSNGVLQFTSLKITHFSDDGKYAFVEGSMTGLPIEQLFLVTKEKKTTIE